MSGMHVTNCDACSNPLPSACVSHRDQPSHMRVVCIPCAEASRPGYRADSHDLSGYARLSMTEAPIVSHRVLPPAMKTVCDACGDKLGKAIAVKDCDPDMRYACVECAAVSRPSQSREYHLGRYAQDGMVGLVPSVGPVISHKLVAAKAKMVERSQSVTVPLDAESTRFMRHLSETIASAPRSSVTTITVATLTAALLELDAQPEALRACEFAPDRYKAVLSKILARLTPAQHRAVENRASAILSVVRGGK